MFFGDIERQFTFELFYCLGLGANLKLRRFAKPHFSWYRLAREYEVTRIIWLARQGSCLGATGNVLHLLCGCRKLRHHRLGSTYEKTSKIRLVTSGNESASLPYDGNHNHSKGRRYGVEDSSRECHVSGDQTVAGCPSAQWPARLHRCGSLSDSPDKLRAALGI